MKTTQTYICPNCFDHVEFKDFKITTCKKTKTIVNEKSISGKPDIRFTFKGIDIDPYCVKCNEYMFKCDNKLVDYILTLNHIFNLKTLNCCEGHLHDHYFSKYSSDEIYFTKKKYRENENIDISKVDINFPYIMFELNENVLKNINYLYNAMTFTKDYISELDSSYIPKLSISLRFNKNGNYKFEKCEDLNKFISNINDNIQKKYDAINISMFDDNIANFSNIDFKLIKSVFFIFMDNLIKSLNETLSTDPYDELKQKLGRYNDIYFSRRSKDRAFIYATGMYYTDYKIILDYKNKIIHSSWSELCYNSIFKIYHPDWELVYDYKL